MAGVAGVAEQGRLVPVHRRDRVVEEKVAERRAGVVWGARVVGEDERVLVVVGAGAVLFQGADPSDYVFWFLEVGYEGDVRSGELGELFAPGLDGGGAELA